MRNQPASGNVAVTVVVPMLDARGQLPELCRSLRAQTLPARDVELLFVDNGSVDGSREWLERRMPSNGRLLISAQRHNAYAARNLGIRCAHGRVLAFTDADCRPEPDWLEQGVAATESMPRAAGRIVVPCSAPTAVLEQLDAARFFRQQRYVLESFAATANLFVRRAVFDAVGHFDERLLSGGDQEFGARAHAAGVPIDYAPAAVVHHAARRSLSELLAKAHRVGVGFGQGLRYHSFAHLGAGPRIADRLRLISHAARRDDLLGPVRLALVAGQTLLAASTAVGLMDGFVGLRR